MIVRFWRGKFNLILFIYLSFWKNWFGFVWYIEFIWKDGGFFFIVVYISVYYNLSYRKVGKVNNNYIINWKVRVKKWNCVVYFLEDLGLFFKNIGFI